jgi:hypothetical protein
MPLSACPAADNCGTLSNGCGGTLVCGTACTAPKTCGGGGIPNVCGCTPLSTCPTAANCGTLSDGCGGTLVCGTACTAPEICGGGGFPNVCGVAGAVCLGRWAIEANGDTVLDTMTGITWQAGDSVQDGTGTLTETAGVTYCSSLGLDGGGWTFPTLSQLQGLELTTIDSVSGCYISGCAFPGSCAFYWTYTFDDSDAGSGFAWRVPFTIGGASVGAVTSSYRVRCMR